MHQRVIDEVEILRSFYAGTEIISEGLWVRVPVYSLPDGWSVSAISVAFQVPAAYPGTPPYGIYVPAGVTFCGQKPANYTEPAPTKPPFEGTWGIFSWSPEDGQWKPAGDPRTGANLLTWVIGFGQRFREGV